MASLKEIKVRIASIRSTQKITAAMKMVSSAKLHHTQTLTEHTLLYANKLSAILNGLLDAECDLESPYTEKREVKQSLSPFSHPAADYAARSMPTYGKSYLPVCTN